MPRGISPRRPAKTGRHEGTRPKAGKVRNLRQTVVRPRVKTVSKGSSSSKDYNPTAPDAPTVRVKVTKSAAGAALPGFTFTQEGSF